MAEDARAHTPTAAAITAATASGEGFGTTAARYCMSAVGSAARERVL